MIFNSYEFILAFLPVTALVFFILGRRGFHEAAIFWLVLASLFFYGWWEPRYLVVLFSSIAVNFLVGINLQKAFNRNQAPDNKPLLVAGIVFNLCLLGYFKYANFFIDNLNAATGTEFVLHTIVLPLAISFFTFQQIAFLCDSYRGMIKDLSLLHYSLFVTFFPQLIAGPIVHHSFVLPQFAKAETFSPRARNIAIGLAFFLLGLFKKVIIADGLSGHVDVVFSNAEEGVAFGPLYSWFGAYAFTLQLYFDFSGYSDMAIGLGRMFGIKLPNNFCSPYKAVNITDFWRRWHMTLTSFLRDYLYIPLGGNRKGPARRDLNMMIVLLLSGFWHGASWNFVIWGGMHGVFLIINRYWRMLRKSLGQDIETTTIPGKIIGIWLTVTCWAVSLVLFRAPTFDGAVVLLRSMFGFDGLAHGASLRSAPLLVFSLGTFVAIAMPNLHQLIGGVEKCCGKGVYSIKHSLIPVTWSPNRLWATTLATIFLLCLMLLDRPSEFLYYQF